MPIFRLGRYLAALAVLAVLLAPLRVAHATQAPVTLLGANIFDLSLAYHGQSASLQGSAAEQWTGTEMARRALTDAAQMGFPFVRVAIGGYGPSNRSEIGWSERDDITPWLANPAAFWARTDQMFADLDAVGIKAVPVLMWNPAQFPTLANETIGTMVKGPSTSQLIAKSFIQSFLYRYGHRKTILFVELTNEWNLLADLDNQAWCQAQGGSALQCAPMDSFSTADLAGFVTSMADFVHFAAPGMLVSTGFSLPRPAAWHLSQHPAWLPGGPDWTADSPTQLAANVAQLHQGADIVSVHIYPGDTRFGRPAGSEGQTVDDLAGITHALGKKLYVGEFGDTSLSAYMTSMLQHIAASAVDYASVWAFEFYQASPYQFAGTYDLDPQYTPALDAFFAAQLAPSAGAPAPRVVLAQPLPCASVPLGQPFDVYALASAPAGGGTVHFLLDGAEVATTATAPYHASVTIAGPELATLQAVLVSNGQTATSTIQVVAGGVGGCTLPPQTPLAPPPAAQTAAVAAAVTQAAVAVPMAVAAAAAVPPAPASPDPGIGTTTANTPPSLPADEEAAAPPRAAMPELAVPESSAFHVSAPPLVRAPAPVAAAGSSANVGLAPSASVLTIVAPPGCGIDPVIQAERCCSGPAAERPTCLAAQAGS